MAELTYAAVLAELDERIKDITDEQAGHGAAREHVFQEAAAELEMGAVVAPAGTGHLLAAALLALYDERNTRLAALKVIEEYESHSIEQDDRLANLAADLVEVRARVREVERERDLATERLRLAKDALVRIGYFTADEVSDDVAPRIIEFASAKRVELEATQDDRDEFRAARDVYRDAWKAAADMADHGELCARCQLWALGKRDDPCELAAMAIGTGMRARELDGES